MKNILILALIALTSCVATRPDPGVKWPGDGKQLLKVCWDSKIAKIEEACMNPEYVEWKNTPVTISSDPSMKMMVIIAAKAWNEELGVEMFTYKPMDIDADIIFARGGSHPNIRGLTMFFKPEGKMRAGILMFDSALHSTGTYIHELGHAIGLRHDAKDTRSIMYPNNGRYFPRVQAIDKKLLIDRYGPKPGVVKGVKQ